MFVLHFKTRQSPARNFEYGLLKIVSTANISMHLIGPYLTSSSNIVRIKIRTIRQSNWLKINPFPFWLVNHLDYLTVMICINWTSVIPTMCGQLRGTDTGRLTKENVVNISANIFFTFWSILYLQRHKIRECLRPNRIPLYPTWTWLNFHFHLHQAPCLSKRWFNMTFVIVSTLWTNLNSWVIFWTK